MRPGEWGRDCTKSKRGEGNGGGEGDGWETRLLGLGLTRFARFGSDEFGTKTIGGSSDISPSESGASGEEKRTLRPNGFARGSGCEGFVTAALPALALSL